MTTTVLPAIAAEPMPDVRGVRRSEPGMRRGSAAKSSSVRTSMMAGALRQADQAGELGNGDFGWRRHSASSLLN